MTKKQQHLLEYRLFRALEALIGITPAFMLAPIAAMLGFLAYWILGSRRTITLKNLARAFPERSQGERRRIARNAYRHFALLMLEFMKLGSWTPEQLRREVQFEGHEMSMFLGDPRGPGAAILVTGHFGAWEIGATTLTAWRHRGTSIIQYRQKNRLIDRRICELRERWGQEIIYSRGAVQRSLSALDQGEVVMLLSDQDAGRRGVIVPFLGTPSSTPMGAAILHLRSRAPLFFCACVRTGRLRYRIYMIPIDIDSQETLDRAGITRVTAKYTAELEAMVRRYPEQYFWMHRRWKTRIDSDAEIAEDIQLDRI